MATGRSNKLVGQIGEFLVCAELGRLGLIATPFAGNVPGYDVIATDERCNSVPIQVKANNGGKSWQLSGDKYLEIDYNQKTKTQRVIRLKRLADPEIIFVFVWLGHHEEKPDRFFIVPHREYQKVVSRHYRANLKRHDGRRPKAPESRHTAIQLPELEPYEGCWNTILDALKAKRRRR